MTVFCFETETTMETMLQYVRVVARELYQEAIAHDLEIAGPVYWIYRGADGQPDTKFNLTVAIPVTNSSTQSIGSRFKIAKLDTFKCLTEQHLGDWGKLGNTYGALMGEIQSKNLQMNGLTREIYLNMDFENPEGNITEVQIGLL